MNFSLQAVTGRDNPLTLKTDSKGRCTSLSFQIVSTGRGMSLGSKTGSTSRGKTKLFTDSIERGKSLNL